RRIPLVYRVHDQPSLEKVSALRDFLKTLDIALPKTEAVRPAHFNDILARVEGTELAPLVNQVILRSQAQAEYANENYGHFGLHLRRYAHFTSPIRRYADLIVHRALIRALDLDLPERKILLKSDGTVDRVIVPERLDAHKLIEEFMILANVAAAEMLEKKGLPLIYRVHDSPSPEKVAALREFLQTLDIKLPKIDTVRPSHFNGILARAAGTEAAPLVNQVILRSQAQAEYAAENYGHFGLHLRRYAHFTSPIRRYADLIVHRALIRALGFGPDGLPDSQTPEVLAETAARISAAERRAMAAERETVDRLIAHHLAGQIGATFRGRIAGVTKAGLFVALDDTGADGFIPAATLGADYYRYDESRHALVGERTNQVHRLGDRVEVRLVEAAPVAGALRFELLSSGHYVPGAGRAARGRAGRDEERPRRVPHREGRRR
ncbi:MAG TPA: RNB domain-containing ribonuclease, partial [Xanthobacteraceae bacterium]|nr:RNB domain-containing ribonuclease [Xanthobacteraceae bacterium]